jgi:hypothetical protein
MLGIGGHRGEHEFVSRIEKQVHIDGEDAWMDSSFLSPGPRIGKNEQVVVSKYRFFLQALRFVDTFSRYLRPSSNTFSPPRNAYAQK